MRILHEMVCWKAPAESMRQVQNCLDEIMLIMQNNSAESPRQDDFNLRKNSKLNSEKNNEKGRRKPVLFLLFLERARGSRGERSVPFASATFAT